MAATNQGRPVPVPTPRGSARRNEFWRKPREVVKRERLKRAQAVSEIEQSAYVEILGDPSRWQLEVAYTVKGCPDLVAYYDAVRGRWRPKGDTQWREAPTVVAFLDAFAPGAIPAGERPYQPDLGYLHLYDPGSWNSQLAARLAARKVRQCECGVFEEEPKAPLIHPLPRPVALDPRRERDPAATGERTTADSPKNAEGPAKTPPDSAGTSDARARATRRPERPGARGRVGASGPGGRGAGEGTIVGDLEVSGRHQTDEEGGVRADPEAQTRVSRNPERVEVSAGPTGYIPTSAPGLRAQYDLVVGVMEPVTFGSPDLVGPAMKLLVHVLRTGRVDDDFWVPIGCRLIEEMSGEHNTEVVWRPLEEAGILEVRPEDRERGRSREFRAREDVLDEFLRLGSSPGGRLVDLYMGGRTRTRRKVYKTSFDGKPVPALIACALATILENGCPVDLDAGQAVVDRRHAEYKAAEAEWIAAGRPEEHTLEKAQRSARGRWASDAQCWAEVLNGLPRERDGVHWYRPAFARDPQMAGRVTERGGLQNASRLLKHEALSPLRARIGLRNFDLASSQPWILVQEFEDAEIDTAWLREYLAADKADYAERAFGDRSERTVRVWKDCLLALVMGARLPTSLDDRAPYYRDGARVEPQLPAIAAYVRDRFGGGATDEARRALDEFRAVVEPFVERRDEWLASLERRVDRGDLRVGGRGGNWVTNAVGVTMNTDEFTGWELRSKLAAFFLQGREAAFVHHLTVLGDDYGFVPVSNQHDGLVTIGEVPEAAVEEAKRRSGLRYATLKEKRYHPKKPVPGLDD